MTKTPLSEAALKHGKLQVRKMVDDRPVMRKHITHHHLIYSWTVRKFAGEDLGETIDWNPKPPYFNAKASHIYPTKLERGFICIKKNLSFEESWAGVVYELHNIALCSEFKRNIQRAYKKLINKETFILKQAQIEFKAIKKSEEFYKNIWAPLMLKKKLLSDPSEWSVGCPSKFGEWMKAFPKVSDYPWKIYSDFYDNHLEEWAIADRK